MPVDREALVRNAEKYVTKGKIEAAIKEYRKVLGDFPNDVNTLNRVGDLYARLEKFDEAVKLFTQIAEQYSRDGFFVKAIAIYKKIIKLDPTSLAVYERLAELYFKQGLINEARTQYQVLAEYYTRHANATSAITIYQRMAEMEPDNPSYRLKLAELFQGQRLFEKALREYRLLADLFIVAGSVDEATQVYIKAFEIVGEGLDFVREAIRGLHEGGHTPQAMRLYGRAVEINPKAAPLKDQLGLERRAEPEPEPEPEPPPAAAAPASYHIPVSDFGWQDEPPPGQDSFADLEFDADALPPRPAAAPEPSFAGGFGGGGFGTSTSFGGGGFQGASFGAEPAPQPAAQAFGAGEAASLDEEFSFDLESDEESEYLVKPPVEEPAPARFDRTGSIGRTAKPVVAEPEIEVGEFAFEIDLGDDTAGTGMDLGSSAEETSGLGASAGGYGAPGYGSAEEAYDLDWSMDAMSDLDLSLPPPDHEPVVAAPTPITDLRSVARGATRQAPAAPPQTLGDDLDFSIDLDEEAPAPAPAPRSAPPPAAAPPAAVRPPTEAIAKPFSLDLDDEDATQLTTGGFGGGFASGEAFVIDLDELEAEPGRAGAAADEGDATVAAYTSARPVVPAAPPPMAAAPAAPAKSAADEPDEDDDVTVMRRDEDLIAEARVFAKYGLKEKAFDRVQEVLAASPRNVDALSLLARFDVEGGRHTDAMMHANQVAELARLQGDLAPWHQLRAELNAAGFAVEGDRVVRQPGVKPAEDDRIAQLLEDLSLDSFERSSGQESRLGYQALLEEKPAAPAAAEPAPAPPPGPQKTSLISLVDELGINDLDDEDDEELQAPVFKRAGTPPAPAPAASRKADPLDETGMSWLDDVAPTPEPAAGRTPVAAASDTIFDEEDDFFDLAAELEAELDVLDVNEGLTTNLQAQEQSLQEIIDGFKQGVAEHLLPEDYDTHFNLGIAYREMGLLDEAIGEFQLSSKDARYLVESASMLGICFMEKGLPELAVRWYRKGLESPQINEEVALGLLYDMGIAYAQLGDYDAAYKTFVEIYGMNSNFRDVSVKLQELAPLRQSQ